MDKKGSFKLLFISIIIVAICAVQFPGKVFAENTKSNTFIDSSFLYTVNMKGEVNLMDTPEYDFSNVDPDKVIASLEKILRNQPIFLPGFGTFPSPAQLEKELERK